jgi:hypothetical protein
MDLDRVRLEEAAEGKDDVVCVQMELPDAADVVADATSCRSA